MLLWCLCTHTQAKENLPHLHFNCYSFLLQTLFRSNCCSIFVIRSCIYNYICCGYPYRTVCCPLVGPTQEPKVHRIEALSFVTVSNEMCENLWSHCLRLNFRFVIIKTFSAVDFLLPPRMFCVGSDRVKRKCFLSRLF